MILGREYVRLVENEYTSWDGQKKRCYEYDPDSLLNSLNYGACFVIICLCASSDKDRQTEQIFIDNISETISIVRDLFERNNAVCAVIEYQTTEEKVGNDRSFFFHCPELESRRSPLSHLIDEGSYKNITEHDLLERVK